MAADDEHPFDPMDKRATALAGDICDLLWVRFRPSENHKDGWRSIYACLLAVASVGFTPNGLVTRERLHKALDEVLDFRDRVRGVQ